MLKISRQALGQFQRFSLNPLDWNRCDLVPATWIPQIKSLVAQYGCDGVGRDAIAAAISSLPGGGVISAIGMPLVIDCVCGGKFGSVPLPPPQDSLLKNPAVWVGIAAAVVGTAFLLQRKKPENVPVKATKATKATKTKKLIKGDA